jgi:hypothetical protein
VNFSVPEQYQMIWAQHCCVHTPLCLTLAAAAVAAASGVKAFHVTTTSITTVPELLELFEEGWPLKAAAAHRVYTRLSEEGFARGLPSNQAQQYEVLRQGYLLVRGVSQLYGISMKQAAAVVEIWRDHKPAFVPTQGTVVAAELDSTAAVQGTQLPVPEDLLESKRQKSKQQQQQRRLTMYRLCEAARGMDMVVQQKDPIRSAAGKAGGTAAATAKKQRTK